MESNTKKAIKVVPLLIALVFMLIALVLVVLEGLGLVEVGIFYKRALEKENTVELSISAPLTDGTFIRLNGRLIYKTRTDLGSREQTLIDAAKGAISLHASKKSSDTYLTNQTKAMWLFYMCESRLKDLLETYDATMVELVFDNWRIQRPHATTAEIQIGELIDWAAKNNIELLDWMTGI